MFSSLDKITNFKYISGRTVLVRLLCAAILLPAISSLGALPAGIQVNNDGSMRLFDLRGKLVHYSPEYRNTSQNKYQIEADEAYPKHDDAGWALQGKWRLRRSGKAFDIEQKIIPVGPSSVDYSMTLSSEEPIPSAYTGFFISLPVQEYVDKEIIVDGKKRKITSKIKNLKAESLTLETSKGTLTLSGDLRLTMVDHRPYKVLEFALRIELNGGRKQVKHAQLKMNITAAPRTEQCVKLPIKQTVNYNPESVGLSAKRKLGVDGIQFNIASRILSIKSGKSVDVSMNDASASWLYLLHNAASTPAGSKIMVQYKDGQEEIIKVIPGIDVGSELEPQRLKNAAVAAVKLQEESWRGVYCSKFKLQDKPVDHLTFSTEQGDWRIFAATTSNQKITTFSSKHVIAPSEDWIQIPRLQPVKPGTPLDFSNLIKVDDAPSGKYGRISVNNEGHFMLGSNPSRRIRLLGTNICFSACYLEKEEAERFASELAAEGFNALRIHHYDGGLAAKGANNSNVFDADKLDKLDYLLYCLKQRGIYVTIDVYCSRNISPGEFDEYPTIRGQHLKILGLVYPPARENWKLFAKTFLSRRNPYTGLTWAEDPSLYSVVLVNEGDSYRVNLLDSKSISAEIFKSAYYKWLQSNNIPESKAKERTIFGRFITKCQIEMGEEYKQFLREIGYEGLVSNVNYQQFNMLALVRNKLDFVDTHEYWDHPQFRKGRNWSLPYILGHQSCLKSEILVPGRLAPQRIFGKPYTVSEISFVYPHKYRYEEGALIGAYSALQNWDGLFFFAWSHSRKATLRQKALRTFDDVGEPQKFMSHRIVALMFRQGMVQSANQAFALPFSAEVTKELEETPSVLNRLGLISRVGQLPVGTQQPGVSMLTPKGGGIPEATKKEMQKTPLISDTGQIIYNRKKYLFKVVTPEIESIILDQGAVTGKILNVSDVKTPQCITAAGLDGKPLNTSKKILVFHQTNALSMLATFNSANMNEIAKWGTPSGVLLRRGKAKLSLQLENPEDKQVKALNFDGTEKAVIQSIVEGDKLIFDVDVTNKTTIYYITNKNEELL